MSGLLTLAWVDIDPIPPVGAVTTHTCGSWYLLGRGGRAIDIFLVFSQNLVPTSFKPGLSHRKLRNGQAGPSLAVPLHQAMPILNLYNHKPVCTVLSAVQLLKENYQPQI